MNSSEKTVSLFICINKDTLEYILKKNINDKEWEEAVDDSKTFRYNDILDDASETLVKILKYSKNKNSTLKKDKK